MPRSCFCTHQCTNSTYCTCVYLSLSAGTGILLAVTIIYQYYEMFEKNHADPNAFVQ
jgi:preprotein translocase subunit SecY